MREVRHTFEHLMVILGVFFICLVIIFAVPGVRVWAFENVPAALTSVVGTGAMADIMAGVNPQMLSAAINDDNMREDLIELWQESLPEMEPDAIADMTNELLADPNTAALLVDLIAEVDPAAMSELYNSLLADPAVADHLAAVIPQLEVEGLANLTNALVASDEIVALVNDVIALADNEATANLLNSILAVDEDGNSIVADALSGLLGHLDANELADFTNKLLADDNENVVNFIDTLIEYSDTEHVALLVNTILDDQGTVDFLDELLAALSTDNPDTDILESAILGDFTFQVLAQEGTIALLNNTMDVLATIGPDTETRALDILDKLMQPCQGLGLINGQDWRDIPGLYDDRDFDWTADEVQQAFNWEEGEWLHKALYGNNREGDSILDYFWVLYSIEHISAGGSVDQFGGEQWLTASRNIIKWQTENLFGQPWFAEWWNGLPTFITGGIQAEDLEPDEVADLIGELFFDDLSRQLGELLALTAQGVFENASYYVLVGDTNIGETPSWDYPFWEPMSQALPAWGVTPWMMPEDLTTGEEMEGEVITEVAYTTDDWCFERYNGWVLWEYPKGWHYAWDPEAEELYTWDPKTEQRVDLLWANDAWTEVYSEREWGPEL